MIINEHLFLATYSHAISMPIRALKVVYDRVPKNIGTLVGFRMKIKYFSRTRSDPPICWIYWFPTPTLADFAITDTILSILSRCVSLEFVKVSRSVEIISLDKSTNQALVRQTIVINRLQHFYGFLLQLSRICECQSHF